MKRSHRILFLSWTLQNHRLDFIWILISSLSLSWESRLSAMLRNFLTFYFLSGFFVFPFSIFQKFCEVKFLIMAWDRLGFAKIHWEDGGSSFYSGVRSSKFLGMGDLELLGKKRAITRSIFCMQGEISTLALDIFWSIVTTWIRVIAWFSEFALMGTACFWMFIGR